MTGHEAGAGSSPAPAFVRPGAARQAGVAVRAARLERPGDLAAVSGLVAAYLIATEREKGAEVTTASALPERYRREAEDPAVALAGTTVLLAEAAGEALGMVVLTRSEQGRCEIKRLWTVPVARGRGVAAALIVEACAVAGVRGDEVLALTVWCWREGARRLYARLGFAEVDSWEARADLVCMERALAPVRLPDDEQDRS
ncbi:GNAT family N-acetyltransferase [Demequina sp. NBRC 110051]|uniref:GNAT family N-acetyltransferase n=1 Tax=Demequina sp. NBRC 110051 TaxID=1570340 RepID=UPI0009FEDEE0|nr:GNAT family N-acetyltransferase [Demequina sp. NBRC 110051]